MIEGIPNTFILLANPDALQGIIGAFFERVQFCAGWSGDPNHRQAAGCLATRAMETRDREDVAR